jgi:hypothetical protein
MQVRPVRLKESRSVAPSSPHALGYTQVLSSGSTVQIASTPHAIVFSKAGKTILDPSMRTVHTPPGLAVDRPGDENATPEIPAETTVREISSNE